MKVQQSFVRMRMARIDVQPLVRSHRRFSRLLLKSLIMSERKSLLTSISSALGEEFFRRVATTFKITGREVKIGRCEEETGRKENE